MLDKKPTENEIVKAKEISLKEQIEDYNKRRKEVFDNYYRRNTEGAEDPLEICVLRESAVIISKFESIITSLQTKNEELKTQVSFLLRVCERADKRIETAEERMRKKIADRLTTILLKAIEVDDN